MQKLKKKTQKLFDKLSKRLLIENFLFKKKLKSEN